MLQKFLFGLAVAFGLLTGMDSCRSAKKIQTAISKRDTTKVVTVPDSKADSMRFISQVYNGITQNRIRFRTFAAKIKVNFEGADGKKNDFNAFVRLYKDSVLWVSIHALLGMEAFRVLITPDSVKVLNKLDKVLQLRSVSYLQEVAKIPFTFTQLQDLIIGNPVYLDSNIVSYRKEASTITLVCVGDIFKHLLTVGKDDYRLQYSKLDDVDPIRARTCTITYGNYEKNDSTLFSTYREITVAEKGKLDLQLQYKQHNFNEELDFPFSVPKNFKRE